LPIGPAIARDVCPGGSVWKANGKKRPGKWLKWREVLPILVSLHSHQRVRVVVVVVKVVRGCRLRDSKKKMLVGEIVRKKNRQIRV